MKKLLPFFVALAALLPAAAFAQDCSLKLINSLQLSRDDSGVDLIPVGINGVQKNFIFDTGGG